MDFINFHIAYLLTKHERVVIPDFGAFIVIKRKDNVLRRNFIPFPVNNSLAFNPEIIRDDGLLVHSIAKEKNVDYTEALRLVHEYVDSLVDDLRNGQVVQFPWIGKIHLSDDRKILFVPARNLSCNAESCGLVNINFPYLNEFEEDESTKKRKKTYKRPVFYIILLVVALLLALSAVFLILKPLNNSLSYSPVASDTLKANPIKPAVDSVKSVNADSVKSSSEYFIIIAGFIKEKEAEVMLNYFVSKGLDKAKIIHSDGKYRISIETFDNKKEALSFLDMIRKDGENPLFKDAWIYEELKSNP
ncbi:MAG: SPOR domain-containing protein [Dysgonamonadaceae bacterium]|jgi:nucleoid DNA-binding protein|nr:SPOR domain-containing protein [Dysgonamonadaceae bacterium]